MKKRDRTRQGELQRFAGDLGQVLPRVMVASPRAPAVGWYMRMTSDGRIIFLGDNVTLATLKIEQLRTRELEHA